MGKASAPKSPDPKETAAAQTSTNISTAVANSALNNVNQVTPYGSLTYDQTGQQFISDPNGQSLWYNPTTGKYSQTAPSIIGYATSPVTPTTANGSTARGIPGTRRDRSDTSSSAKTAATTQTPIYEEGWTQVRGNLIPTYTATQTLSPEQQAILDETQAAQLNLGRLANTQSAFLQDYMSQPVDLSNENVRKYIEDAYSDDFNKQWDTSRASLESQLANQGIKIGSAAYTKAMSDYSTNRANAYDNLYGNQYNTAVQNILAQRNQPINEITALLSGSQVTTPTYAQTAQSNIPTTDYAGLVQQDYQNKLSAWQQQQQASQGILGGIFGLGGKLIGLSDERAKKDIEKRGEIDGMGLYAFRYKGQDDNTPKTIGLMAQEVKRKRPEAIVNRPDGLMSVDYEKALKKKGGA